MTDAEFKQTLSLLHIAEDKKLLSTMTDKEWQQKFEILKLMNKPTKEKRLSRKCGSIRVMNRHWTLSHCDSGDGVDTLDARYCAYINDILKIIRSKGKKQKRDCCFHIYQIGELLRFEPDLKTRLVHDDVNTYIEVWLDKSNKE